VVEWIGRTGRESEEGGEGCDSATGGGCKVGWVDLIEEGGIEEWGIAEGGLEGVEASLREKRRIGGGLWTATEGSTEGPLGSGWVMDLTS
jgi:hypothetical protein